MSQKPKTGAQVRPAVTKAAEAKGASRKSNPVAKTSASDGPVMNEPKPIVEETVPDVGPTPVEQPPAEAIMNPDPHAPVELAAEVPAALADPPTDDQPEAAPGEIIPEETVMETVTEPVTEAVAAVPETEPAEAEPIEEIATATVDTVAAAAAEVVATADVFKPTNPTLTQGLKKMMKSTEEFVAFSQANMEAFVKSGQIWSAGVQELTKQMATTAKATFDESVSTFKAISTAKSVKEAMEMQASFAKAALEKAMTESNKLTDASIKLTEETLAPITARVTVAVESFKTH